MTLSHDEPPAPAKLTRSRLSNQAADALKRAIVDGTYPPGARLPTEKALAESLGVTRLTVREALSQLSSAGFVDTRHGSGTYVIDVRERESFGLLTEMLAAGRTLTTRESDDLMRFRSVVTLGFASAISAGATDAHVAAIRALVATARATGREPRALAELDYRINEVLADASGNAFFTMMLRSLREVYEELGSLVYREHEDLEVIFATLDTLADALERRQEKRFARALSSYVDGGALVLSRWLEKGKDR